MRVDIIIVGAGVVGLSIASHVAKNGRIVLVLERNPKPGQGISSRSSEVLHAGFYYPPGSRKAILCVQGNRMQREPSFAQAVSYRRTRKLVVAKGLPQVPKLEALLSQGQANGVPGLRIIDGHELRKKEPCIRAVAALESDTTGIIDSHGLVKHFHAKATSSGAEIVCNTEVIGVEQASHGFNVTIREVSGDIQTISTAVLINATGLSSDEIAEMVGLDVDSLGLRLHYWKGEYFSLNGWRNRIKHLVYTLPEANTQGLGIHTTIDLVGNVRLGPNAIYLPDRQEEYGVPDSRRDEFYMVVREYLADLEIDALEPGMAGIRPKLTLPGEAARDFYIAHEEGRGFLGLINCIGIESPGITAAPAIGSEVGVMVDEILK